MIRLWESKGKENKILCPLDRRQVSMLIPAYALRSEVSLRRAGRKSPEDDDSEDSEPILVR